MTLSEKEKGKSEAKNGGLRGPITPANEIPYYSVVVAPLARVKFLLNMMIGK